MTTDQHHIKEYVTSTLPKVLLFCLLYLVISFFYKKRKIYLLSWKLPGPVGLPFLGNARDLRMFTDIHQLHESLHTLRKKYGEVYRVWLGPEMNVVFTEPEDFEIIMQSKLAANKGPKYDIITGIAGPGLLSASGQYWRNHRHLLNPAFNSENLRNHINMHNKHAKNMVNKIQEVSGKRVEDVSIYLLRYSVGTIAEYLYGIKENYHTGEFDDVVKVVPNIVACFYWRMCKPWYFCDLLYDLTESGKETKKLVNTHYGHFRTRLLKMYDDYMNVVIKNERGSTIDRRLRTPFQVMLEAHADGKMSKDEIQFECNAMYFPGVDSLYSLMSFFLLMMAVHEECQEKVWEEIVLVMGDDQGPVLPEHIPKFKYLDMCIKETNRLFPTGTSLLRSLEQDLHIKHRNITIPVGATILLSVYMLNRNPKYWRSPDSFVPERFLPEEVAERPTFSYVPFSAGLRNCIGKTFGSDAAKIAAVHLLRNFIFSSDLKMNDLKYECDISIRSSIGYPMFVHRRKNK